MWEVLKDAVIRLLDKLDLFGRIVDELAEMQSVLKLVSGLLCICHTHVVVMMMLLNLLRHGRQDVVLLARQVDSSASAGQ
jgi:hypothetical protein